MRTEAAASGPQAGAITVPARLGIGGLPFLFPLLYQIGLGYTAVQSGLLMMTQTLADTPKAPYAAAAS